MRRNVQQSKEIPLQMMRTIVEIGRREKINTSLCLLSDFMLNQFRFFPIFDFLARKITEKENSNLMVIVILEVYICNLILFISFRRFLFFFWFDKFCYSVFFFWQSKYWGIRFFYLVLAFLGPQQKP